MRRIIIGVCILLISGACFADEFNRDLWTLQHSQAQATIVSSHGYQKMKLVDTGAGKAVVVFTHLDDQAYCGGQDALFKPIPTSIDIELEAEQALLILTVPALIGCNQGISFAEVNGKSSMKLIGMLQAAARVKFYDQSFSLNGFEAVSKQVIQTSGPLTR